MPVELPDDVCVALETEAQGAHTQHMQEMRTNVSHANNIVRLSVARQLDEPSPAEARAVDKILRLPNG